MEPDGLDPALRRTLASSQPWLLAGAGALWMLMLGVGALLLLQISRAAPVLAEGLSGVAGLVGVIDLVVLMVGVALMALSLGRQVRAIEAALTGGGSVDEVLRRIRRFWWVFAATLVGVALIGCGALFTGTVGAFQDLTEQAGDE